LEITVKITGFKFTVNINGKDAGFQSVKTNGDTLELVKHVDFMDDLPESMFGTCDISVFVDVGTSYFSGSTGTFNGYGISRHPDDKNLMRIVLTRVQFNNDVTFDLDGTKR